MALEVENICCLYKDGKRIKDIATDLKLNAKKVGNILRGAGITVPWKRNRAPGDPYGMRVLTGTEELSKLVTAYEAGKSIAQLSRELAVGWDTVKRRLETSGAAIRNFDYHPSTSQGRVVQHIHEQRNGKLKCPSCQVWKLPQNFHKRRDGHPKKNCTPCQSGSKWDKHNSRSLRVAERKGRLALQDNKCDICKSSLPVIPGRIVGDWDHNHETGNYRGILCSGCNSTLARYGDTLEVVEEYKRVKTLEIEKKLAPFIKYLTRHDNDGSSTNPKVEQWL